MTYPEEVKSILWSEIHLMSENPWQFAINPGVDFSRKRKLDFEKLVRFLISMGSGTTRHELLKYFDYGADAISNSAFYQQRQKLLPEALRFLLRQFNSHFPFVMYKGKYMLVVCDGSEFNIARNPDDPDTFVPPCGTSKKGFNMIHTISLYDILGKRYLDCVVQPGRKKNEFRAICDLCDRYSYEGIPIFIADRGLSSYNFYAHATEKGIFFIVRAKDIFIRRLLKLDTLPDSIDEVAEIILTRSSSKKKMEHPEVAERYRYISTEVTFDYIEPGSGDEYPLSFRIVRFETADGAFCNVITNLPSDEFPVSELKELYHLRWDIETAFRDLKQNLGTTNFHSKKIQCIEQEILARMVLYNFCAIITIHVVIDQKDTKHVYRLNFAMALKICHDFIRLGSGRSPPDVESLIGSNKLPIRLGRNYARQHRFQFPASFAYRFS